MQHLVSAIESRGLRIGKAVFQELTGLKKPVLDSNNILHWPVLLLYAEVMSSDFIEDFCETDMFTAHLDTVSIFLEFFYLNADVDVDFGHCVQYPWISEVFVISFCFKDVFRKLPTTALG